MKPLRKTAGSHAGSNIRIVRPITHPPYDIPNLKQTAAGPSYLETAIAWQDKVKGPLNKWML
jgi:hypothetical protein